MSKRTLLMNFFGLAMSCALLVGLFTALPTVVLKGGKDYRQQVLQDIRTESDITILRQKASAQIGSLLGSNQLCGFLLFVAGGWLAASSAILAANVLEGRRARTGGSSQPAQKGAGIQ